MTRTPTSLRRRVFDHLFRWLAVACFLVALVPLVSVIVTAAERGYQPWLNPVQFLTGRLPLACSSISCDYGGVGPPLQGTLILVGLASLIALPVGILGGVYVSEFGRNPLGRLMSFLADVMSGTPSIVVGLFTFTLFLNFAPKDVFTTISGAIALSVIMLPVVIRTTEESLRLVPRTVREASLALGIPEYRGILRVVLPTGGSAIVTGAILAVARAAGEAAPLLLTAFGLQSPYFFQGLTEPVNAIPPLIYLYATSPASNWKADAWGMALLIIMIMLALSLSARYMLARRAHLLAGVN